MKIRKESKQKLNFLCGGRGDIANRLQSSSLELFSLEVNGNFIWRLVPKFN